MSTFADSHTQGVVITQPAAVYNVRNDSWVASTNDTTVHYVATSYQRPVLKDYCTQ